MLWVSMIRRECYRGVSQGFCAQDCVLWRFRVLSDQNSFAANITRMLVPKGMRLIHNFFIPALPFWARGAFGNGSILVETLVF